jgi:putative lipoprotein
MPKPTLVLAALVAACPAAFPVRPAYAADPDPFWGPDKALHFVAGGALAAAGYAVTTSFTEDHWKAFAIGGGVALGAGAMKEGLDALGYGDPSWKDFAWDAIGAAVGLGIAFAVDAAVRGSWPPLSASPAPTLRITF